MTPPRMKQCFFNDPALDRIMAVTMVLAAEVFVLRSQLRRLTGGADDAPADTEAFVRHLLQATLGEQQPGGRRHRGLRLSRRGRPGRRGGPAPKPRQRQCLWKPIT